MVPQPSDFFYHIPQELIATNHAQPRDHSRLMVVNRQTGQIESDMHFFDIEKFLKPDDVLVLNQTKVFPARIFGQKLSGGQVEVLLLQQTGIDSFHCISKPGLKVGQKISFPHDLTAITAARYLDTGEAELKFNKSAAELLAAIDTIGITPLPHYINTPLSETEVRKIYQTVYAKNRGSAAAPTAGLHFTKQLLARLQSKGVRIEKLTLHVGLGTFQPLRPHNLTTGKLHREEYILTPDTAQRLHLYKSQGKRIIAVGTTSARALESNPDFVPGTHHTDIFIYPPYKFKVVDGLITNFHLPESSLLMMITAFSSFPNSTQKFAQFNRSLICDAYSQAIKQQFKFFSFGDAMFIC